MKKFLTLAILGVTGLAGAVGAEAQDGHRGVREYRQPAPHRHGTGYRFQHRPEHRPNRIWIAPRTETRIVGYECGRPITRVVIVAPGFWSDGDTCR